jgi:histone-lysine N-methyltransferase SETMAR
MRQVSLQQNNARPHMSARTTAEIHLLGFTVSDHPPYSPDMAPSDFHLFPKMKKHFRGPQILSGDEVKTTVKTCFH